MRSLPLPLALTARLLPVAVLASAGWALTSGPFTATSTAEHKSSHRTNTASAPSTSAATVTYRTSPAPCEGITEKTITSLVPGAKATGREIPLTDKSLRRTCSWNGLNGYDYRWLDVSFGIKASDTAAQNAFKEKEAGTKGGETVSGLGDEAYATAGLTTEDKQQTQEAVLTVRVSNALVVVTYSGSDFETKGAPKAAEIREGALKAAKEAVAALEDTQQG